MHSLKAKKAIGGNWQRIVDYELRIWEVFLEKPRYITPKSFFRKSTKPGDLHGCLRKIALRERQINWSSQIGIGGILLVNGEIKEFFSLEVSKRVSPWLKGLKQPHRMINFFELLATYIGLRLWSPNRLENKDLKWLEIPMTTDNLGNDFILKKKYTSKRPTAWMLQEIAARSLTNNITITSDRKKGDSGKWSILADKVSRNISFEMNGILKGHQTGKVKISGSQTLGRNNSQNC